MMELKVNNQRHHTVRRATNRRIKSIINIPTQTDSVIISPITMWFQ